MLIHINDQIKENKNGWAYERLKRCTNINYRGQMCLRRWEANMTVCHEEIEWTGFMWFRRETSGGQL